MATVTIQYWAAAREAAGVELESVEASTLAEALDLDAAYARSWSLGLDLWLLIRTPLALLRGGTTT